MFLNKIIKKNYSCKTNTFYVNNVYNIYINHFCNCGYLLYKYHNNIKFNKYDIQELKRQLLFRYDINLINKNLENNIIILRTKYEIEYEIENGNYNILSNSDDYYGNYYDTQEFYLKSNLYYMRELLIKYNYKIKLNKTDYNKLISLLYQYSKYKKNNIIYKLCLSRKEMQLLKLKIHKYEYPTDQEIMNKYIEDKL